MTAGDAAPAPTSALYRVLPYPADGVVRTTVARVLRRGLERHAPELLRKPGLRIADLGCGTGEVTCGLARRFPQARVVGVDINPPSLEHARRLAQREGLSISFVEADLSEGLADRLVSAGVLAEGERFDVAVSMGVLHHLDDPSRGFVQVRRITAPSGLFLCYVYSAMGRRDDACIKQMLDEAVPSASDFAARAQTIGLLKMSRKFTWLGAMSTLRRRLRFGPPIVPSELIKVARRRNRLVHVSDTFSCPREYYYRFAEVERLLSDTGWSLLGLAKGGGLPTRPQEHTRSAPMREALGRLPLSVMADYFAFHYRGGGFTFFARPA